MEVVAAASRLRFHHFGNKVKVNYLVNLKSGLCPEDCFYCSQRLGSTAGILRYTWLDTEDAVAAAKAGISAGASRVCLVASGTGPSNREVGKVTDIIEAIKSDSPGVEVCACLGALQGIALYVANSLFLGDYLTSEGQPGGEDLQMIADAGLEVLPMGGAEGAGPGAAVAARGDAPGVEDDDDPATRIAGTPATATRAAATSAATSTTATRAAATSAATKTDPVAIRTRGAGTSEPANA